MHFCKMLIYKDLCKVRGVIVKRGKNFEITPRIAPRTIG
jgi:hypothetical protein